MEGPICLTVQKIDATSVWFSEKIKMPNNMSVIQLCEHFNCKRAYRNSIPLSYTRTLKAFKENDLIALTSNKKEDYKVIDWKFNVGSPKDRLRYIYALEAEQNRLLKKGWDNETRKFFKRCMKIIEVKQLYQEIQNLQKQIEELQNQ